MVHSDRTGRHTQEQVEVKEVRERERKEEGRGRRRWREDGVNLSSRVQRRGGGEKKRA